MAAVGTTLDPITFAVVRNGFAAAADKAFTAFKRTGMVPLIYDSHDFAISIYDDRFNLVSEAAAVPLFAGALGNTVSFAVADIGQNNLHPRDVIVTNLPRLHGSHPADGVLIEPVFHDNRIVGYVALRAHMGDMAADSISPTDTTEVFQEGLLLPPLKLYDRGVLQEAIIKIIQANSRLPIETSGDFMAGAGALRAGVDTVAGLVDKYGIDTYYSVIDGILDHGERVARQTIERIPDGVYSAERQMDDDGVVLGVPVPVRVTVTVSGNEITVDTSESSPQVAGPINCPMAYTQAAIRMVLKTLSQSKLPSNSGEHRVLKVIAPEGNLFNPGPMAASFSSVTSTVPLTECILHALAPALPDEIPAMSACDIIVAMGLMQHPVTGRWGVAVYVAAGGYGARAGDDGPNALYVRQGSGLRSVPLEVLEARYPVVRHRFELHTDSGGPGQWRGGLGMVEELEHLVGGVGTIAGYNTSGRSPIKGLAGGGSPAVSNGITYFAGTDRQIDAPDNRRSHLAIQPGDGYVARTTGGGGYGDPHARPVERVADDVRNGYVSVASARSAYGVVVDEQGHVDEEATRAERRQ